MTGLVTVSWQQDHSLFHPCCLSPGLFPNIFLLLWGHKMIGPAGSPWQSSNVFYRHAAQLMPFHYWGSFLSPPLQERWPEGQNSKGPFIGLCVPGDRIQKSQLRFTACSEMLSPWLSERMDRWMEETCWPHLDECWKIARQIILSSLSVVELTSVHCFEQKKRHFLNWDDVEEVYENNLFISVHHA